MDATSSDWISQLQPALEQAVREFRPVLSQAAILEQHKPSIIRLRVKGATYREIRELLGEHGIQVSHQSVIRFCRKYSTEIKRAIAAGGG